MVEISVIIPCFNAEKYINRCLDSLFVQTIDKSLFEIICIDDGSNDDTFLVLTRYKEKYPELNLSIVRCEQNYGPSHARNIGIIKACGKYLNFLDIDDVQTCDAYQKLLEPLKNNKYDAVIGKHIRARISSFSINNKEIDRNDQICNFPLLKKYYWHNYTDVGNNGDFFTLGAALISREVVIENNVFFPEKFRINEDDYWYSILQLYIKNVYIVDWIIHLYVINENSLMTTGSDRLLERRFLYESLLNEYKERGVFYDLYPMMVQFFLRRYLLTSFYVFTMRMDKMPDLNLFNELFRYYNIIFPDWFEYVKAEELMGDEWEVCKLMNDIGDNSTVSGMKKLSDKEICKIKGIFEKSRIESSC